MLCNFTLQVLRDNIDVLSRNLEPSRHYSYLRSASVLNVDDQEIIESQLTRSQRTMKLVDIIRTKGPRAFDALYKSLEQDKTQPFLMSELNQSLEREKGMRVQALKPGFQPELTGNGNRSPVDSGRQLG